MSDIIQDYQEGTEYELEDGSSVIIQESREGTESASGDGSSDSQSSDWVGDFTTQTNEAVAKEPLVKDFLGNLMREPALGEIEETNEGRAWQRDKLMSMLDGAITPDVRRAVADKAY